MLGNKEMKKTKDKYLLAFFLIYMVVLFRITVFRSTFSLYHVMENGTINLYNKPMLDTKESSTLTQTTIRESLV